MMSVEAKSDSYYDTVADVLAGVDYYALLGVTTSSTEDEIRKAYRKMAMTAHPDQSTLSKEEATELFARLGRAKDVLRDVDKRFEYDDLVRNGVPFVARLAQAHVQVSMLFAVVSMHCAQAFYFVCFRFLCHAALRCRPSISLVFVGHPLACIVSAMTERFVFAH